jgi:hypothetical protein
VHNYIGIRRIIRRLRGGSQAFLVQGEDSLFYAAKFAGNPQGSRTLINEWIAGQLLRRMGVSTPLLQILMLDQNTEQEEELCFKTGHKTKKVEGQIHLGSQYPVNPTKTIIMDIVPRPLLPKVVNLVDFATILVVDQWLGQTDSRQAVFVRDYTDSSSLRLRSYFIDHGLCFGGSDWEFRDSPKYGIYLDPMLYSLINLAAEGTRVVSRIQQLPEDTIYAAAAGIPPDWLAEGDHAALAHMLRGLERRRQKLTYLLESCVRALETERTSVPTSVSFTG